MEIRVSEGPGVKVVASIVSLLALFLTMGVRPASAGTILYDNGAYTRVIGPPGINGGYSTTDSFVLSTAANVTSVTLFVWEHSDPAYNGSAVTSVGWSITSSAFGGATYASGTATPTDAWAAWAYGPAGHDNLRSETFSIPSLPLGAGTYWLQIQNGVAGSDVLTWDSIGGASQAYTESPSANIMPWDSEAFQVLGDPTGTPEPGSFGLLAAGVLGMAALLRRRTAR